MIILCSTEVLSSKVPLKARETLCHFAAGRRRLILMRDERRRGPSCSNSVSSSRGSVILMAPVLAAKDNVIKLPYCFTCRCLRWRINRRAAPSGLSFQSRPRKCQREGAERLARRHCGSNHTWRLWQCLK